METKQKYLIVGLRILPWPVNDPHLDRIIRNPMQVDFHPFDYQHGEPICIEGVKPLVHDTITTAIDAAEPLFMSFIYPGASEYVVTLPWFIPESIDDMTVIGTAKPLPAAVTVKRYGNQKFTAGMVSRLIDETVEL